MKSELNIFTKYFKDYFYNSEFRKSFSEIEFTKNCPQIYSIELKEIYGIEMREYLPTPDLYTGKDNHTLHKIIYNNTHINSALFNKKNIKKNFMCLSNEGLLFFNELFKLDVVICNENSAGILNLFVIYEAGMGLNKSFKVILEHDDENCFLMYINSLKGDTIMHLLEFNNIKQNYSCHEKVMQQCFEIIKHKDYTATEYINIHPALIGQLSKLKSKLSYEYKFLDDYLYLEKMRSIITMSNCYCPQEMLRYCRSIIKLTAYKIYLSKIENILCVFLKKDRYIHFFRICSLIDFITFSTYVCIKLANQYISLSGLHLYFCNMFNVSSRLIGMEININHFYNTYFLFYYRKYVRDYKKIYCKHSYGIEKLINYFPAENNSKISFRIGKKGEMKERGNVLYAFSPIHERIGLSGMISKDHQSKRKIDFD